MPTYSTDARGDRSLVNWPEAQPLQGRVVSTSHNLLDTGLFTDANLLKIFDAHDPDALLVYRMGDSHEEVNDFKFGSRGDLSAQQLIDAVQSGKIWLNILDMADNHPEFKELVNAMYDELEAKVPGFKTVHRSANLLVSSPQAQVFYHADAPLNMLWHLRGQKRVWVYPGDERFAPRESVEKIFTRESDDDLPYDVEFEKHATFFDLEPGTMLTWPQNTPHRVENISGINVSLTTEHYTPEARKKRETYMANRYLRLWFGLPTTATELNGIKPMLKRAAYQLARRLPGFAEYREQADDPVFALDDKRN